jgi:hypothetical protein
LFADLASIHSRFSCHAYARLPTCRDNGFSLPRGERVGQLYCVDIIPTNAVDSGPSVPTLVWVHGMFGSSNTFCKLIPMFGRHRSIAVDLLGFGRSAKPSKRHSQYTIAEHVGAVNEVGRSYEIAPPLVGCWLPCVLRAFWNEPRSLAPCCVTLQLHRACSLILLAPPFH